jgi:hypothetical protein
MTHGSDGWDELLGQLDDDEASDAAEWGESFTLEQGDTFVGWWRGQDIWSGEDRATPVYLLRNREGGDVFHWGGRAQLDKRIAAAAPQFGDRIAIRRLEDASAEPGRSPAWRIRVAVTPGEGSMPGTPSAADADDLDDLPF